MTTDLRDQERRESLPYNVPDLQDMVLRMRTSAAKRGEKVLSLKAEITQLRTALRAVQSERDRFEEVAAVL